MAGPRLPSAFADLEPFAEAWCLASERERHARRLASSMPEMKEFYAAMFERVDAALAYCDRFPLDELPDDAARLLRLVHSFVMVSFPVEVWGRPDVPDTGDARLDRVVDWYPLSDQEITCRHFHKTAGDWVNAYRREASRAQRAEGERSPSGREA